MKDSESRLSSRLNNSAYKITRYSLISITTLIPLISLLSLLIILTGSISIKNYTPAYPCDEVIYYQEIKTFVHHSFSGGYFTIDEEPAKAAFTHFGWHGPMFTIIYGTIGKIFGWELYSGPLFNVMIITLALLLFLVLTRLSNLRLIVLSLFLITFWPYYRYVLSNFQESLHMAAAIIIALIFYKLLYLKNSSSRYLFSIFSILFICFISLIRINWSMFLLPLFLLIYNNDSKKYLIGCVIASVFITLCLIYINNYIYAPVNSVKSFFSMNKIVLLNAEWNVISTLVLNNISAFLSMFETYRPENIALMIQLFLIVIVLSVLSFIYIYKEKKHIKGSHDEENRFLVHLNLYNILGIFLACFFLYFLSDDFAPRILMSHVILLVMLLIASRKKIFTSIVIAIIFINVIFSPQCIDSIKEIHKIHFQLRDNIEQFSHEIKKTVNYQDNADAWCNTLVVYPIHEPSTRIIDYPPQFAGLPAGFGTSVIFNLNNVKLPIKSKYIFTDIETINKLHLRVKLLAKLSGSRALFLNLDAKCKQ